MIHKMNAHTEKNGNSMTRRRKERERIRRQKHIIRAAEKVFARRGFQGATIHEIASEAELAVGTIYNFFVSKEALYSEIITSRLEEMRQEVLGKIQHIEDVKERLKTILLSQSSFIEKNKDFFIIFIRDQNRFPWAFAKDLGQEVSVRYQRYLSSLKDIFKEGIRKGVFKSFDPEDLAEAWGGMCNSFFFKWLMEKPAWALKTKALILYEIFMRGVEK